MQRFFFPKSARLLKNNTFRYVAKNGKEISGKCLKIQFCFSSQSDRKLGITITKRFGKANKRNYFKRLVRESFRFLQNELPTNILLNVKPKGDQTLAFTFQDISNDLLLLKTIVD